jgi:hypothetical protein
MRRIQQQHPRIWPLPPVSLPARHVAWMSATTLGMEIVKSPNQEKIFFFFLKKSTTLYL